MANFDWDSKEYEPSAPVSREPLPEGVYKIALLEADIKPNKSSTGTVLTCKFEVTDGPRKGAWIWQRFNVEHTNPVAERIARQQIEAWKRAANKPNAKGTDALLGVKVDAQIKLRAASGGYSASNELSLIHI